MENSLDYIQEQFNKIEKYEQLTHEFEGWFKKLDYNQLKDKDWYQKIESAVINHLAKKNYCIKGSNYFNGWEIKIEDENIYKELKLISNLDDSKFKLVDTGANTEDKCHEASDDYKNNIDIIRQQLFSEKDGIDQTYLNNIFNDELDNFEGKNRDDTPAKFIYGQVQNFAKKQEGKYYSTEPRWFGDSDKFRTEIFKIVKRLKSFEAKAKKAFSDEKNFDIVSTWDIQVNFWNLIKAKNFVAELEDYFKGDNEQRKAHKLKKLFSYIPEKSINADNLGKTNGDDNSFAWRNIILKQDSSIPEKNKQTIFCSLVEFYGKDFFDKLPEDEKKFILDFYKEHLEFKLSDPSIIGNFGDKNKQNEVLDLNIAVIKKNLINQNLSTNKNEISETNHESKKIKKSYTKARFGTGALGISFVLSLILAWQISIYILIASAILLTMLIICLIALKKNGFECTKIFCCCMDVGDEPEIEIPKDNNLSNLKSNGIENLIE